MSLLWLVACSGPAPRPVDAVLARMPGDTVRFVAVGDVGKGNATQHAVADAIGEVCARQGCDFALLLGDNLYPDGMDRPDDPRMDEVFTAVYGDLDLTFHAVLGNHDYGRRHYPSRARHQLTWAASNARFEMPAHYYRFQSGPAAFWALDTDAVFWNGVEPQGDWLDETLAPDRSRWRVVFGHHPYRSNGEHGNAGQYEGLPSIPYASGNALKALFEGHVAPHADLYLSGHEHNLQSIRYGTTELVVSGAGASARELVDRGNSLRGGHAVPGFAWVELSEVMTLAFYDETAAELDRWTVPHPR